MSDALGETHVLVPTTTVSELRAEVARLRAAICEHVAALDSVPNVGPVSFGRVMAAMAELRRIAGEDR